MLDLRARGNVRGWDSDIRSVVSAVYADYIGYESDAVEAYNAETNLIPGLLQTHAYAASVLDLHLPDIGDEERHERLAIRDKRQEVFDRPNLLIFWAVVSQSVFRHVIGGPEVMAEQLEHLSSMAKQYPTTVNLYVMPEESPWHGVVFGSFMILSFQRRWEPDIVYLDGLTSNRFLEREAEVSEYSRPFRCGPGRLRLPYGAGITRNHRATPQRIPQGVGMSAQVIQDASSLGVEWQKSSASSGDGNCVELGAEPGDRRCNSAQQGTQWSGTPLHAFA